MSEQRDRDDWSAPGPGTWELDTTHYPPTASRIARDIVEHSCPAGLREGFDRLGAPLATLDARFVRGHFYRRAVPIVGADSKLPPPPGWALKLAFRVVPTLRRRAAVAESALADGSWRSEFDQWEAEWKPELTAANRRFGAIDETALSDDGLADHLDELYAHLLRSATLHFRLHTSDLGPIGLLLTAADDWGLDQAVVMDALAGASPATSAPAAALTELRDELRRLGVDPATLDDVRAAGPGAEELLDAYLAEYGSRLTTGYDISDATLAELPGLVLASVLDDRPPAEADAVARGEATLDRLRAELPGDQHERFDELVTDARLTYGLRDENGPITFEWPAGVLRRAVLEAARRLGSAGHLLDREHVFDASAADLSALLRGAGVPTPDDLSERCMQRLGWADLDAPLVLGPPAPDPPLDALPEAMGTMMRVSLAVMDLLEAQAGSQGLDGTGIGVDPYRGVARVVADADEALDRAEPGDVIVTRLTVPTFNSVLAIAGAVVTEHGGLLCHTAVIARELGIPAVVGVADALTAIPDGAEVEVDPVLGRVSVLT